MNNREVTIASSPAQAAALPSLALQSASPVTSGAILKKYVWEGKRGSSTVSVNVNVIAVDMTNPYVKLDAMTGNNGELTQRNTVISMAQQTGAVAGVNGDYFDVSGEGAPIGPEIQSGTFVSSPSKLNGMYAFGLTTNNQPVINSFQFTGKVGAADGQTFPLSGVNEAYYWYGTNNAQYSHANALYLYTDAWGSAKRADNGWAHYTEVLVTDHKVAKIAVGGLNSAIPKGSVVLWGSGDAKTFLETHLKVGDPVDISYALTSADGKTIYDPTQFKMMIGGHTILVDNGKPAAFSRDVSSLAGYRSRTGIGYSKDGKTVYIITADHAGDSAGLTLSEFQNVMVQAGVWRGMNLDGGGSTQMVARPLGDFNVQMANKTEFGSNRSVVNGLGVYSTAPKGAVKGLMIYGDQILFLHETSQFQLKAYDQYYNPVDTSNMPINWTLSGPIGKMQGNTFTATRPGQAVLTGTSGQAKQQLNLDVVGYDQIASMAFADSDRLAVLSQDVTIPLQVQATTVGGVTKTVPSDVLDWQLVGFQGHVDSQGNLTVTQPPADGQGEIIARYDGFSTMLTLPGGVEQMWADFDQKQVPVSSEVYPSDVSGIAYVTAGIPGEPDGNQALYLAYNFKPGTGTKAAYARFGPQGTPVPGAPIRMRIDVDGDNSFNWLRAEVTDKNGQIQRIDLTQNMDWTGWKTLDVDLSKLNLAFPVTLNRIYVADPEQGQDEREPVGEVAMDNIRFVYKAAAPTLQQAQVKMTLGQTAATVNGETVTLPQAPIILHDTTMLPVRFFVEVMGGQVSWDAADKKVTVIRGGHLLEMRINQADVIADGKRITADVPPTLVHNNTLLPLRLIAEQLGWQVGWDSATHSITLQ